MNARILIGTLGFAALAVGLGQLTVAVAQPESDDRALSAARSGAEPATNMSNRGIARPSIGDPANGDRESEPMAASHGADIQYTSIYQIATYGPVGDIYAYSLGSRTCNIGDEPLIWNNQGSPGFASSAYRLHNGRLMQIGTAWVKHACCVANVNSPTFCGATCSQTGGGSTLNAGCLDTYSAGWNALQSYLGPRTNINPQTGQFASLPGGTGDAIYRRLQIHQDEITLTNYPGALFFVDGVYVCTTSAQAGNINNNGTYRRVTFNQTNFSASIATQQSVGLPAIFAWQEHGLGVNTPDPSVNITTVDLPNEGRFFVSDKVTDNGDGTWTYDYAVYNLTSHQAAGSFRVDIGSGVNITDVGFHSPPYHSGENQDMTPWPHTIVDGDSITWTTAHSHAQNPNANAVRWGSMHNFWFTADQPPVDRDAFVGVFIPGVDSGAGLTVSGPADPALPCPGDLTGDGVVNISDMIIMFNNWTGDDDCPDCNNCLGDLNDDCKVNTADLLLLFDEWGDCP